MATLIQPSQNNTYYINPAYLAFVENSGYGVNFIQVSASSSCYITVYDPENGVSYNVDSGYRKWKVTAYNNKFPDDKPEYLDAWNIYVRLERSGTSALIIYDQKDRAFSGGIITKNEDGSSIVGDADQSYYYIKLGVVGKTDGVSVIRSIIYDTGNLNTPVSQNAAWDVLNAMFRPHYDDPLNPDTLTWIEAKAHMGVAGGMTSFIDNGSFKLPSIYDGLPIDNQTLYWEEVTEQVGTDEEGNPIYETTKVLKAQGGGSGGGVADSVHWNNIEGKPDFSQYVTKDSLSGYLPLSGGTMTGQINMPVGIGKAIKFGAESRLFAYNGNFYISAETNLILASGASGNNVPNNAVIDKTGRMFIANNLVVGRASFITDSYKLNVAGDAYVNGNFVVGGTIYPSISSLHNIGDSSKRFACAYADSVDVGGVKISLLQDGVLLIDGNLAVTGGITSYVDGGNLDLPSIYDGLPIDGDTLYWVLDENGKKVMLKSKGDNNEGGGVADSVNWDNIEGKPSWIGDSKPSYLYSEIIDTPDLTKYALKESIPSLSGYATQSWVKSNYLPLSGEISSDEFVLKGNLRLKTDGSNYHRKLNFGDGDYVYLKEYGDDFLNIYADSGVKIYDNTTDHKEYIEMTRSGITLSTTSSNYISIFGKGVKVNNGIITYNEEEGYFYLDGNLAVSGGVTAFADEGAGNQWIMDVETLEEVVSDNPFKTYSAKVVSMIASNITNTKEVEDGVKEALDKLEIIEEGLSPITTGSSTTISVLRDTLVSIRSKLIAYVRDTE